MSYSEHTTNALAGYIASISVPAKDKDEHGQPPKAFYRRRIEERVLSEMLGIAKGILADGVATEPELRALLQWLKAHPDVAFSFPGDVVSKRLVTAFADGVIEKEERADLQQLLRELVGDEADPDSMLDTPTKLAFDDPLPTLLFDGWEYVVTGRFAYGPRTRVEAAISARGGRLAKGVSRKTDVLVVGTFSSNAWLESTHGTKILAAYEVRNSGYPVRVVPEAHWYQCIQYDE